MRVSSNIMFETGAGRIGDLQSALNKTMQQISTNRRVLTPADDAVAAARALDVSQAQAVNQQYGVNRQNAKTSLMMVESTLQGVTPLLHDLKGAIVRAGNGGLKDSDRASIATELRGRFDELLGLANSTDGSGNYLFSGYQVTTPAFSKTTAGAQYQGDAERRQLQVEAARTMDISDSGQKIFQGDGKPGEDIFKTLQDLITLLETPVVDDAGKAKLAADLATANGNLDKTLDNVLTVRASIGARLNEIDALDDTGSARDIQYQQNLSDLIGLDPVEAYSRLMQQQITLQAAQKAYVSASGLSLFQYM
ncbi:MAG TPA: flagellar hook-associated protein FlgL [Burkholderiaceae bacterium]|nr:flagellar hook-associated protein FlgL [Burkholderiaceae bacterium]